MKIDKENVFFQKMEIFFLIFIKMCKSTKFLTKIVNKKQEKKQKCNNRESENEK